MTDSALTFINKQKTKTRKKRTPHPTGFTHESIRKCQSHMLKFLNHHLKLEENSRKQFDELGLDQDGRRIYIHRSLHQQIGQCENINFSNYDKPCRGILDTDFMTLASWLEIPEDEALEVLREAEKKLVFTQQTLKEMAKGCEDAKEIPLADIDFSQHKKKFKNLKG
ncbi:hypothetical protein, partial [Vibrio harveyi]